MAANWYDSYIDPEAWAAAWDSWNASWTVDDVQKQVEAFVAQLARQRAVLERARGQLLTAEDRATWSRFQAEHAALAAPLAADGTAVPGVGAVPLVAVAVVVGGLALGAWAVAWAVAKLSLAYTSTEAIELWQRELEIRWEAAQRGIVLPDTTIPDYAPNPTAPPGPDGDSSSWWLWGLLGLGVAAGGAVLYSKVGRA